MKHPEGSITDLELLQNIIILGISVWYVPCRGVTPREWLHLRLEPKDCGLALISLTERSYLTFLRIHDETWDQSVIFNDSLCGYIFTDIENALKHSKSDQNHPARLGINKIGIGPFK